MEREIMSNYYEFHYLRASIAGRRLLSKAARRRVIRRELLASIMPCGATMAERRRAK